MAVIQLCKLFKAHGNVHLGWVSVWVCKLDLKKALRKGRFLFLDPLRTAQSCRRSSSALPNVKVDPALWPDTQHPAPRRAQLCTVSLASHGPACQVACVLPVIPVHPFLSTLLHCLPSPPTGLGLRCFKHLPQQCMAP